MKFVRDGEIVEDFDQRLQLPANIVISGGSQSGKSYLALKTLFGDKMEAVLSRVPRKIVLCYTQYQSLYREFESRMQAAGVAVEFRRSHSLDTQFLEELAGEHENDDDQTVLILDDCTSSLVSSCNSMITGVTTARHLNISIVLLCHSTFLSNTSTRVIFQNCMYTFLTMSPRAGAQVQVMGRQLNLPHLTSALEMVGDTEKDLSARHLLIDSSPRTPSYLRVRGNIGLTNGEPQTVYISS